MRKPPDIHKQEIIKIIESNTAPLSCNTCIFRVKRQSEVYYLNRFSNNNYYYERPYCRITDEYLDTELGIDICEVSHFIKKLLEMI